jgi:hypothetical protein
MYDRLPTHQPVDEDAAHLAVDLRLLLHVARVVPRVDLLVLVVHVLVQDIPDHRKVLPPESTKEISQSARTAPHNS